MPDSVITFSPNIPADMLHQIEMLARIEVINGTKPTKRNLKRYWNHVQTGARIACLQHGNAVEDVEIASRCWAVAATRALEGQITRLRAAGCYKSGRA